MNLFFTKVHYIFGTILKWILNYQRLEVQYFLTFIILVVSVDHHYAVLQWREHLSTLSTCDAQHTSKRTLASITAGVHKTRSCRGNVMPNKLLAASYCFTSISCTCTLSKPGISGLRLTCMYHQFLRINNFFTNVQFIIIIE